MQSSIERRDELLRQLDLTDRRGDYCETLSGGLKRRVELAKGMLHRPRLLLLDEPSTGLDPAARLSLWDAIRSMADDGMAVLLTTHLLEEADKADRVAIMSAGKIIAEGSPQDLRTEMGEGVVTVRRQRCCSRRATAARGSWAESSTSSASIPFAKRFTRNSCSRLGREAGR